MRGQPTRKAVNLVFLENILMKKQFIEIAVKLRKADALIGRGKTVPEVCREIGVSQQTYYCWRNKYGGTSPVMFSPVVVAPTYNNSGTLLNILDRINALGLPFIVVNDGSSDNTALLLPQWLWDNPGANVRVLTHQVNRGKATALMTGFRAAGQWGYTHVATIDTDRQLDPEQLPQLIEAARQLPQALVLGFRDDKASDYPRKSRLGRRISNMTIRLECGQRIRDSQCGLRVYPLALVLNTSCRAGRFGYETEIITRAVWAGCPIVELPANCHYLPYGQRVTHFKVGRDTIRHIGLHIRLLALALRPWHSSTCTDKAVIKPSVRLSGWRRFVNWVNPKELFQAARHHPEERTMLAIAIALGVFIANLPIYGFQTLASLYLSRKWHLHPLAIVFGSHFSTPPIGPALIAADIWLGHLLLTGQLPAIRDFSISTTPIIRLVGRTLMDCILGSLILGVVLAATAFLTMLLVFRMMPVKKSPEPEDKPVI